MLIWRTEVESWLLLVLALENHRLSTGLSESVFRWTVLPQDKHFLVIPRNVIQFYCIIQWLHIWSLWLAFLFYSGGNQPQRISNFPEVAWLTNGWNTHGIWTPVFLTSSLPPLSPPQYSRFPPGTGEGPHPRAKLVCFPLRCLIKYSQVLYPWVFWGCEVDY